MRYLILCLLLALPVLASGAAEPSASSRTVLVLGDSLSAAYRIAPESGWIALLEQRLMQQEPQRRYHIVNASISGETTAGGLARLPKLLADNAPALVLVELGANDGLRGLALEEIRANLQRILKACRDAGAKIVLVGIELPVNYGPQYREGLRNLYRDVAHEFNVPLVPFLLEGVATDPTLMQDDGLHPVAAAEPRVLDTVWPVLAPVLRALR
jgi:acyl-CoA thioesterase I